MHRGWNCITGLAQSWPTLELWKVRDVNPAWTAWLQSKREWRDANIHIHNIIVAQSCLTLCDPMDYSPTRLLCPWNAPGKNTRVDSHFLLQGIFLIQELNPCLLHCRQILIQYIQQSSQLVRPQSSLSLLSPTFVPESTPRLWAFVFSGCKTRILQAIYS